EADRHPDKGRQLAGMPIAGVGHIVLEVAIDPTQSARFAALGRELKEQTLQPLALQMKIPASANLSSSPAGLPNRPRRQQQRNDRQAEKNSEYPPVASHTRHSAPRRLTAKTVYLAATIDKSFYPPP